MEETFHTKALRTTILFLREIVTPNVIEDKQYLMDNG